MRLGPLMRRSIASAAGTQLLPGTPIQLVDPELPDAPRPRGTVIGLMLDFDGENLELQAVGVRWTAHSRRRFKLDREDLFQADELGSLEIMR